jgi:hypothetical protein
MPTHIHSHVRAPCNATAVVVVFWFSLTPFQSFTALALKFVFVCFFSQQTERDSLFARRLFTFTHRYTTHTHTSLPLCLTFNFTHTHSHTHTHTHSLTYIPTFVHTRTHRLAFNNIFVQAHDGDSADHHPYSTNLGCCGCVPLQSHCSTPTVCCTHTLSLSLSLFLSLSLCISLSPSNLSVEVELTCAS